jgi:aspartyl-tRNA(Asn)/glutamyl-tRNA(Gln) amidotransferase subunit A
LVKLTKSTTDIILPTFTHVGNLGTSGETYAYHEEYFKRAGQRYILPIRRRLEAASKSTVTAAEYVRFKWGLDLLRRTVDDPFTDVDVVIGADGAHLAAVAQRHDQGRARRECFNHNEHHCEYSAVQRVCDPGRDGLTFAGPHFSEGKILALARAFERATEWHKRGPAVSPTMPVRRSSNLCERQPHASLRCWSGCSAQLAYAGG